jgi:hypothetical protein
MKRFGMGRRFPLVRGAERRRDRWPDRASWSGKPVFSRWDSRVFEDYLEAGVSDAPDGTVTLRYPKAWEARIFEVCRTMNGRISARSRFPPWWFAVRPRTP